MADYIWLVEITHKHGMDIYVCKTRERAEQALAEYVTDNWNGDTLPESQEDRISEYFRKQTELYFGPEFFEINHAEILE
jgi:hypothetical protein